MSSSENQTWKPELLSDKEIKSPGTYESQYTPDLLMEASDIPESRLLDSTVEPLPGVRDVDDQLDTTLSGIEESIAKLRESNEAMLRGELSGGLQDIIREGAAQKSMAAGVGTQAPGARRLAARDIGRTSEELRSIGQQQEMQIAGLEMQTVQAREQRYQFNQQLLDQRAQFIAALREERRTHTEQMQEQARQYDTNMAFNLAKLGEESSQFAESSRLSSFQATATAITNLNAQIQEQARFNSEQNRSLIALLADQANTAMNAQLTMALSDKDLSSETMNNILSTSEAAGDLILGAGIGAAERLEEAQNS